MTENPRIAGKALKKPLESVASESFSTLERSLHTREYLTSHLLMMLNHVAVINSEGENLSSEKKDYEHEAIRSIVKTLLPDVPEQMIVAIDEQHDNEMEGKDSVRHTSVLLGPAVRTYERLREKKYVSSEGFSGYYDKEKHDPILKRFMKYFNIYSTKDAAEVEAGIREHRRLKKESSETLRKMSEIRVVNDAKSLEDLAGEESVTLSAYEEALDGNHPLAKTHFKKFLGRCESNDWKIDPLEWDIALILGQEMYGLSADEIKSIDDERLREDGKIRGYADIAASTPGFLESLSLKNKDETLSLMARYVKVAKEILSDGKGIEEKENLLREAAPYFNIRPKETIDACIGAAKHILGIDGGNDAKKSIDDSGVLEAVIVDEAPEAEKSVAKGIKNILIADGSSQAYKEVARRLQHELGPSYKLHVMDTSALDADYFETMERLKPSVVIIDPLKKEGA